MPRDSDDQRTALQPVTIAATGGLGNQLFQLAAAMAVADATGRQVRVCCRMYDRPTVRRLFLRIRRTVRGALTDADGRFMLDAMSRAPVVTGLHHRATETDPGEDRRRGLCRASLKQAFRDDRFEIPGARILRTAGEAIAASCGKLEIPGDVVPLVAGYMQDDRLVAPQVERLRAEVRLPASSPYLDRWHDVLGDRTVGVHVRRGDYMKPAYRDRIPILPPGWYRKAAEIMRDRHGEVRFLVITDDPGWARSALALPGPTEVASAEHPSTPQEDLALLSRCAHHVISNSTFGWWGARLARGTGSVVVPRRWMTDGNAPDWLVPSGWTILDNPEDDR